MRDKGTVQEIYEFNVKVLMKLSDILSALVMNVIKKF